MVVSTWPSNPRRALSAAALVVAGSLALAPVMAPLPVWARETPESFADLVEQVNPAVVQIVVKKEIGAGGVEGVPPGLPEGFPEGPFKDFFERFFKDQIPGPMRPHGDVGALGSGFVIDPSGIVVTNNHVISDAKDITVKTKDGEEYPAELVGADDKTDLAVLRVKPKKPLAAVGWGDSDKIRVGDWVVAVGNPFGLGGTVTAGIVSARGREIGAGPYDDFIQIDAPINTGNSGGPLFNVDGAVVGVNTAIYSPNGGNIGIGFAIPSDMAAKVVAQLRETGSVERGWLGVMIQPVTPEVAESLGLDEAVGALVTEVTPDSPAAKAGLRQGDVVLSYDGKKISTLRDLSRAVADTAVGSKVSLKIVRDHANKTIVARIGAQEREQVAAATSSGKAKGEAGRGEGVTLSRLGLTVAPLDAQTRTRLGVDAKTKGVVIADVAGDQAADKGLRAGDIITSVNQKAVSSPSEVAAAVEEAAKADRKAVLLLIERDGQQRFVAVELAGA
jgi:serine protease Do